MSFPGADPEALDRMAAACVDGANVLVAQVEALKVLKGWLFGPPAVVAIRYLRRRIVPMLEAHAEALREMARVLTSHPDRRGVFGGSSGWGIPLAVVAGGSGADNVRAGIRTLIDGTPHETLVHQTAAWAAHQVGASNRAAWWVGFTADTGLGLGSGIGSTYVRGIGLADEAARLAPNTVYVGTRAGNMAESAFGHNIVGSRLEPGVIQIGEVRGREVIGQLFKYEDGTVGYEMSNHSIRALQRTGHSVHQVETSALQALQARQAMRELADQLEGQGLRWGVLGPNCTTTACEVLGAAGVNLPPTARLHPYLLDRAVREFPYQGGPATMITTGDILNRMGTLDAHAARPAATEEQR